MAHVWASLLSAAPARKRETSLYSCTGTSPPWPSRPQATSPGASHLASHHPGVAWVLPARVHPGPADPRNAMAILVSWTVPNSKSEIQTRAAFFCSNQSPEHVRSRLQLGHRRLGAFGRLGNRLLCAVRQLLRLRLLGLRFGYPDMLDQDGVLQQGCPERPDHGQEHQPAATAGPGRPAAGQAVVRRLKYSLTWDFLFDFTDVLSRRSVGFLPRLF